MNENYHQLAEKYGLSLTAVQELVRAIQQDGGKMAQFNHPELGGMGQWMPGAMMIGDMFNHDLKARIERLCHELAQIVPRESSAIGMKWGIEAWWSDVMGDPSFSGGQNDLHYAYFSKANRLWIKQGATIHRYDTGNYRLSGVAQQQSNTLKTLSFVSEQGVVTLSAFTRLDE